MKPVAPTLKTTKLRYCIHGRSERQKCAKCGPDVETPITDDLIETMLCGKGIPKCDEWDRMVEHAREMERRSYTFRAIAAAVMKK